MTDEVSQAQEATQEPKVETTETKKVDAKTTATEQAAPATETKKDSEESGETERVDLRNLQDKFHKLLEERNHYNDLARAAREDRNQLHEARRENAALLEQHKNTRDELNKKAKEHRERRNAYQAEARALSQEARGSRGGQDRSIYSQVRKLRNDIQHALERQETQVLTVEKERDLVDSIRRNREELAQLEAQLEKQTSQLGELDAADKNIKELRDKADEEHAKAIALSEQSDKEHEAYMTLLKEVRSVQSTADRKHKEFIALKTKADESHNKAMELREQVVAVRSERQKAYQARRQEIDEFNRGGDLNDPDALKRANEDALEALKSGGKITLGF